MREKEIRKLFQGKTLAQIIKLCGPMIGSGSSRDVYELKADPNYVVKIERDMSGGDFCNVTEWRNYINNKEWKWFEQYLAPCVIINQTGQVLVQRRIEHKAKSEYPKKIPAMFTDTKYANFGWIEDRFVCCDYAFIPFYIIKIGNSKYKRAKWWG